MGNKILIADDSKLIIALIKSIFEGLNEGHEVIVATDGEQAIDKAINELPDIILMDWQMPVMSGIEALKELKLNEKTKNIPIIMLTASESTSEAFDFGASDYILKPFNKTELVARVKTLLELVNVSNELKKRNIEYKIQREKFKLQKDILVLQKKEILEIQDLSTKLNLSISNVEEILENSVSEYFFISKKIDTIASNLFWICKNENMLIFCACFFSKNAIPASMISLAIHNFLNEILLEKGLCLLPSEVLQLLNEKLKISVTNESSVHRFIDLVYCTINLEAKVLQYAGINVPVFVMKKDKLVELKTDKSEIGFTINGITPLNHKVHLAEGDIVYLMNDGFNINKIGLMESGYVSNDILEIVKKIHTKDLSKQKQLLEKAFDSLKHKSDQINDILAFGKRL
jgi:DNA-binding response OmpR family regulator